MPKAIQRTFGSVIRERRRQLDLTQEDVATRIKTSTPYIGHLESGKRHPSEKVIARLSVVLGLQSRELFFLANPRTRDLLSTANSGSRRSAWEEFRHDDRIRRSLPRCLDQPHLGHRIHCNVGERVVLSTHVTGLRRQIEDDRRPLAKRTQVNLTDIAAHQFDIGAFEVLRVGAAAEQESVERNHPRATSCQRQTKV